MKNFFLLLLFVFFSACHKNAVTKTDLSQASPKVIVDPAVDMTNTGDPFTIDSLFIKGNVLSLMTSYSGGCAEHDFTLFFNGKYDSGHPETATLLLRHNANNDHCRELIMKVLQYDITSLIKKNSSVIIKLGGFEARCGSD